MHTGLHPFGFKLLPGADGALQCHVKMPHALEWVQWPWEEFLRQIHVPGAIIAFVRGDKRYLESGVPWIRKAVIGVVDDRQDFGKPGTINLGRKHYHIDLREQYSEAACRRIGPVRAEVFGVDKRWWIVAGELAFDHFFFGKLQQIDLVAELEMFRCFLSDLVVEHVGPADDWHHMNRFCLERQEKLDREIARAVLDFTRAHNVLAHRGSIVGDLLRQYDTIVGKLPERDRNRIGPDVARARELMKKYRKNNT